FHRKRDRRHHGLPRRHREVAPHARTRQPAQTALSLRDVGFVMDCREAQTLIVDDARGRLSADEQARLREHLEGCEACAHEQRVERELSEALANRWPKAKAPASLVRRFRRRASAARAVRSRRLVFWSTFPAVAAAFALAAAGFIVFRGVSPANDDKALVREAINDHLRI